MHDNPYNARQIYDPEIVKSRATSIAADGQLTPAPACRHFERPAEVILIDGGYRKRALQLLGRTEIRIRLEDVRTPRELARLSRVYNKERDDGTALDDALAWRRLLDEGIVQSQDELADLTGVSKAVVSRTLGMLKLPEAALAMIREQPRPVSATAGYELSLLSSLVPDARLLDVIGRVLAGELSTRDLEELRKNIVSGKSRKTKETSRQYKIHEGASRIGVLKEWDDGRVAFEIKLLDPQRRTELVEELKRRFGVAEAGGQAQIGP